MRLSGASRGALLFVSAAVLSCKAKPATAIVVAVSTEGVVPRDLDRLQLVVHRGADSRFDQQYDLPTDTRLPGTLTLEKSSDGAVTVEILGSHKGAPPHVIRRATLGFVDEKTKLLRMTLRYSCYGTADCGDGSTCKGGTCEPDAVDVATLADFTDDTAAIGGAGHCIDELACFGTKQPLTVASCKATAPAGRAIGVTYAPWPDRRVALIQDGVEGYTRDGDSITLAPGICAALTKGRITEIYAAATCAEVSADQPTCAVSSNGSGGASGKGGSSGGASGKGGAAGSQQTGGAAGKSGAGGAGGAAGSTSTGGAAGKAGAGTSGASGSSAGGAGGIGGGGSGGTAVGTGGSGAVAGFTVASVGPAAGVVQKGPFQASIVMTEPIGQLLSQQVMFDSSMTLGTGAIPPAIDMMDPNKIVFDVSGKNYIPGVPYAGQVVAGYTSKSGDVLKTTFTWSLSTQETPGTPFTLFPWVNTPQLATAPSDGGNVTYLVQQSNGVTAYLSRYEAGSGFVDAVAVQPMLPKGASTGQIELAGDGVGAAYAVFYYGVGSTYTLAQLYRGPTGPWTLSTLAQLTQPPGSLQVVAAPGGLANVIYSSSGSGPIYRIITGPSGPGGMPQVVDTPTSTAYVAAGMAPDGNGAVCWYAFGGTLTCATGGIADAAWSTPTSTTTAIMSSSLVVKVANGGTGYVGFQTQSGWSMVRFTPGPTFESEYALYTNAGLFYQMKPGVRVAANGDAFAVAQDAMSSGKLSLVAATCVKGVWTDASFPTASDEGWFAVVPNDTAGGLATSVYYRRALGDLYQVSFDGAGWNTPTLITTSMPPFGASNAQTLAQAVGGKPLVLFQDQGASGLGTMSGYRAAVLP